MATKAKIRKGYLMRPLLLAVLLLGYGLWAADDAYFDYPEDNRQAEALEQFKEEVGPIKAYPDQWQQYAAAHDLPMSPNDIPEAHGPTDLYFNYGSAYVCLPLGLVALAVFLRCTWLWLAADENGLSTSTGKRVPWGGITDLDRSRWQIKGISVVHYKKDGQGRRITLDDWKYETEPIREIHKQVEARLGLEPLSPTPAPGEPGPADDAHDSQGTDTSPDQATDGSTGHNPEPMGESRLADPDARLER